MKNQQFLCPCSSNLPYDKCCSRFHRGDLPENALTLMRSRYAAYVLNLPEYIIKTTHPASPHYVEDSRSWSKKIADFSQNSQFTKLEVHDFQEYGNMATVAFTAHLKQDGQDSSFTEKSFFEKLQGRWLYRSGQISEGTLPNLITNSQIRPLPLAYYGNPILRKVAAPIEEITPEIRRFIEEMIETMDACDGVGLAAPQVHQSIRLFVIRTPKISEDDKIDWGDVKVLINPVLSEPSAETWKASEGCLSIPTIHADVIRPKAITVEYTDLAGKKIKMRCAGWEARVIMHENDHINGVLFIDRLDKQVRKKLEQRLEKLYQRIHDGTEL